MKSIFYCFFLFCFPIGLSSTPPPFCTTGFKCLKFFKFFSEYLGKVCTKWMDCLPPEGKEKSKNPLTEYFFTIWVTQNLGLAVKKMIYILESYILFNGQNTFFYHIKMNQVNEIYKKINEKTAKTFCRQVRGHSNITRHFLALFWTTLTPHAGDLCDMCHIFCS